MRYARPSHNPANQESLLAYFIFLQHVGGVHLRFLPMYTYMCISGRDVQKVIPSVVILAVRGMYTHSSGGTTVECNTLVSQHGWQYVQAVQQ